MSLDVMSAIKNQVAADRRERLKTSPQLTLGELIAKLEAIPKRDDEQTVSFDFGYSHPTGISSWRGSYDEIALHFEMSGDDPKLSVVLDFIRGAVGKTFTGWKGGEYVMGRQTPVWVSNPGDACHTAVVGVRDVGWQIVLDTAYSDF